MAELVYSHDQQMAATGGLGDRYNYCVLSFGKRCLLRRLLLTYAVGLHVYHHELFAYMYIIET